MKFFTFRKSALAHKSVWQRLHFRPGKGYFLTGTPPVHHGGEPKNESPFTRIVKKLAPKRSITMYDSVDVSHIPADAVAVAGYVNGHWPTFDQLHTSFPHAHRLSIAVSVAADAECLDVEEGDATVDQAPAWVKRQLARGVARPAVYTSVSQAARLVSVLTRAGVPRAQYRLWTAHYTLKPHRCTKKCGFGMTGTADATQYSDKALGRSLDASLAAADFFGPGPAV